MLKLAILIFALLINSCEEEKKPTPPTRKVINRIKAKLAHHNHDAKIEAAEEVIPYGVTAVEAVPGLMVNINHDNHLVRRFTLIALASIGPYAQNATKLVIARLKDTNDVCVQKAVKALISIRGAKGEELLYKFLKNQVKELENYSDPAARIRAAKTFGRLGPYAEQAVQYLGERLIYDKDSLVRKSVAEALGKIRSTDALPYLESSQGIYATVAAKLLKIDSYSFFIQKSIDYSVYTYVPGQFKKITDNITTPKEMAKLKKAPYKDLLFVQKSHLFYLDKRAEYKPYFDKHGRGRKWASFVYIYSKAQDSYSKIDKLMIPELDLKSTFPIVGKRIEPYRYVRDAASYSIKQITGQ